MTKGASQTSQSHNRLPLFTETEAAHVENDGWIDGLINSAVFTAQSKLLGRRSLPLDLVRRFLVAFDEGDGIITRASLAQKIEQPELRVGDTIDAMRRLLNVEGYNALSVDATSGAITLDRELLRVTFELR